jgi:hypothetical protein
MPHRLIQLLLLALLLSQCSQPVEFERDSPMDPQSDTYSPFQPTNLIQSFNNDYQNRLAWQVSDASFDSFLIERKTTLDTGFVRLAALPKNITAYVDTSGLLTYPMSYRVASVYRREGKEFITHSAPMEVQFGAIGKPAITYNTINRTMGVKLTTTFKIPFQVDYWVKRPGMDTYEKIATLPGPASNATQSVALDHEVFRLDVAVVYSFTSKNLRNVVDSVPYVLPVHIPQHVNVTTMTEANGRIVWTNPYAFHDDIVVRVNDDEWILPDTTTSLDVGRYFRASVPYTITVQYRKDGELGVPASVQKTMTIIAPSISITSIMDSDIHLHVSSSKNGTTVFNLGEYYVLEMSRDLALYVPIDSVKVTASSHNFTVSGLDTTASYMFRARSLTSEASTPVRVQYRYAWGNQVWDGVPNAINIRHFSPYHDLYVIDEPPSSGVYNLITKQKMYDVPLLGTGKPNGFTNKGGFLAQISSTTTQTTLRHYNSDGDHSGDFVIPSIHYVMGHFDDVMYYNPVRRSFERVHIPTKTTTDIETHLPQVPSVRFARFGTRIAMHIETEVRIYSYSDDGRYVFESSFSVPYVQTSVILLVTDTHVIYKTYNQFRYYDLSTGTIELITRSWSGTFGTGFLGGYDWMIFYAHDAYFYDIRTSSKTRLVFHPLSTHFSLMYTLKVSIQDGRNEIYLVRRSNSGSIPHQVVKLTKHMLWVEE